MKEKITHFIKPTMGKVILALGFLSWQYGYSYLGLRINFLTQYGVYFSKSFSGVDWNNYFIRNFSLFLVWVGIALIIFFGIWLIQLISVTMYNQKIRKNFLNQPTTDYAHLLKDKNRFSVHLKSKLFWLAGIMIFFISLFALSDLIEQIRYATLDSIVWSAFENGTTIDMYSPPYTIGSFVTMIIPWYFISAFIVGLFAEQKSKEQEEEISEEHFAIEVDSNLPTDAREDS
jgi:hypothetical protein